MFEGEVKLSGSVGVKYAGDEIGWAVETTTRQPPNDPSTGHFPTLSLLNYDNLVSGILLVDEREFGP
jgi:hypothetical protein